MATPATEGSGGAQLLGSRVVFVNFDGGALGECEVEDVTSNCSAFLSAEVVEAYSGDAAKRAQVIQIVRSRLDDFGVTITDTRPASGDYDMTMVGDPLGQPYDNIEAPPLPFDCFDEVGGQITRVYEYTDRAEAIAESILLVLGASWGLDYSMEASDLMSYFGYNGSKAFRDECLPIGSFAVCEHDAFCAPGAQNSYRELLALHGPSVADTQGPSVEITYPQDGALVEEDEFSIVVRVEDNLSPFLMDGSLVLESAALEAPIAFDQALLGPADLAFPVQGLPDGQYTLTFVAFDESDNSGSDEVSFEIGDAPMDSGASTGEADDDAATGETGDGEVDTGEAEPTTGLDASGDDAIGRGCGCRQAPPSTAPLFLSLLGLLRLRRRRR